MNNLQISQKKKWLYVSQEMKKDIPFFGSVGLLCGLLQWIGYTYFGNANWGSEILFEHVAFYSLGLIVIFTFFMKVILEFFPSIAWAKDSLSHVVSRAVAFASAAAMTIIGFGLSALLTGAVGQAILFLLFAIYFVALAEFAANPIRGADQSLGYWGAVGVLVGTPLSLEMGKMFSI